MTRINEYLWHLPHEAEADDPPEIGALIEAFNWPLMDAVGETLGACGYVQSACDVMVKLDERLDATLDTYYANVRYVKYLQPNVMTRVHFQHTEWALFLPEPETHHFYINLDRFKTLDATQQAVPAWEGRLHTRLSSRPGDALFFEEMDQQWTYHSPAEMEELLTLFLDKFTRLVIPWLENMTGIS